MDERHEANRLGLPSPTCPCQNRFPVASDIFVNNKVSPSSRSRFARADNGRPLSSVHTSAVFVRSVLLKPNNYVSSMAFPSSHSLPNLHLMRSEILNKVSFSTFAHSASNENSQIASPTRFSMLHTGSPHFEMTGTVKS